MALLRNIRNLWVQSIDLYKMTSNFHSFNKGNKKDRNGETKENTNWFNVVFFGKMADVIDRLNVEHGTLVYVSGKMNFRQYTKESGDKVNIAELMGDGFQILSARRSDGSIQPTENAPTEVAEADELPF